MTWQQTSIIRPYLVEEEPAAAGAGTHAGPKKRAKQANEAKPLMGEEMEVGPNMYTLNEVMW